MGSKILRVFVGGYVLSGLIALNACGVDAAGEGKLKITTWGEDYIEQGIPADKITGGFAIHFDRFLVAFSDICIADAAGDVGGEAKAQRVFDLTKAGPHEVAIFDTIGARRWDRVGLRVAPAVQATAGNARAADVDLMNKAGHSVYIAGTIQPPGAGTKALSFAWGFSLATRYEACEDTGGKQGVVVPTGGSATVQFTIHGDHFFYDSLQADAKLRVAPLLAADADGDNVLTLSELGAVDLTTLPLDQYDTGGDGQVKTLGDFVSALSRTIVHFQGEGHCHSGS
ncbi:MAG: hypothetical protein KAI47_18740 [Deltaproteobacteria bacterium]|nr:hypothetical protein [Deltaproteobacteria bacterium]